MGNLEAKQEEENRSRRASADYIRTLIGNESISMVMRFSMIMMMGKRRT